MSKNVPALAGALHDLGDLSSLSKHLPSASRLLAKSLPGLSSDETRVITGYMHAYGAREDSVLFREGDEGDYLLLILEGIVQVVKGDPSDGNTIALLESGKMVGEMALIERKARSATCVALRDCVLAVLHRDDFEQLLANEPRHGIAMLKKIALQLSTRLRIASEQFPEPGDAWIDV